MKKINTVWMMLLLLCVFELWFIYEPLSASSFSRDCDILGTNIIMDSMSYYPDDQFSIKVEICNPDAEAFYSVLFVYIGPEPCIPFLSQYECPYGTSYWPSWTVNLDYEYLLLSPGISQYSILDFILPADATGMEWLFCHGSGTYNAHAILANSDVTQIMGDYSIFEFQVNFDGTPPAQTPTPSPTPDTTCTVTPVPTATMTPYPHPAEIDLFLPKFCFSEGDIFYLSAHTVNHTAASSLETALLVVLDAYGAFYFYPSWRIYDPSEGLIDYEPVTVADENRVILEPFSWPSLSTPLSGLHFYGALCNPEVTELISNFDDLPWESSPDCN